MNPFLTPPPADIPLDRAPLELVLAGIRFPDVLGLAGEDSRVAERLQAMLLDSYPEVRTSFVRTGVDGDEEHFSNVPIWRFHHADGTKRFSVNKFGLTLESRAYESREVFLGQFFELIEIVEQSIGTPLRFLDRVSIRYVNRIEETDVSKTPDFIHEKLLGMTEYIGDDDEGGGNSVGTVQFALPGERDRRVLFRYGRVRPSQSLDISTVPPIDSPSWLLDIDVACNSTIDLVDGSDKLQEELNRLAERAYTIFRWSVTDAFLRHFGGEL